MFVCNDVRVKIAQKGCANLTKFMCPSSDGTMTSSIGEFLDGVAFRYGEGFATKKQCNRKG